MKLIPPDLNQCQAMKPNGATFMSLGGVPGYERCKNKPTTIVTELYPNKKDGLKGSMSLCDKCFMVLITQKRKGSAPDFTSKPI